LQFWVCGIFEVHAGRITLGRDYFDMFELSQKLLGELVPIIYKGLKAVS
jgi:limonene-1,2-epoxide hydrolase